MAFNHEATSVIKAKSHQYSADNNALSNEEKQEDPKATKSQKSVYAGLGWLDRLLALWILLAIVIGILLGNFVDGVEDALQRGKFVQVSVPIGKLNVSLRSLCLLTMTAVGLLVMMYPMLCKIKFETLHRVFAHRQIWIQLGFSIFVNWIVAPLVMVSFGFSVFRVFTD